MSRTCKQGLSLESQGRYSVPKGSKKLREALSSLTRSSSSETHHTWGLLGPLYPVFSTMCGTGTLSILELVYEALKAAGGDNSKKGEDSVIVHLKR